MSERELLATARKVAHLQQRKRKLRRELKKVDADLKHEKKMLKALIAKDDPAPRPDVVPSRVFGDAVGFTVPKPERSDEPPSADGEAFVSAFDDLPVKNS